MMQQVSQMITGTLDDLGIGKKYRSHYVIMYWKKIVGSEIADHSCAVDITKGIMTVHASNSVWMHHLFLLKRDIIHKINTFLGEELINDIRFRIGAIKNIEAKEETGIAPLAIRLRGIRLTKEEVEQVRQLTADISNPLLKKKLVNILYKNKAYCKLKKKKKDGSCAANAAFIVRLANFFARPVILNKKVIYHHLLFRI